MRSAGGSNSNHTPNPSLPPPLPAGSLPRRELEKELVERFVSVMQRRLEEVRMRKNTTMMDGGRKDNRFPLEDKERKVLLDLNSSGLLQGVAAGAVSFFFLRRARANFIRRMMQQRDDMMARGSGNSGSAFASPPQVRNSPFAQKQQPPNAFNNQDYYSTASALDRAIRRNQAGFHFSYIFGWTLDALVAFMVASFASLLFTDVDKAMQSLAELPLIEGRSRVADEFCPDMVLELARLQKEAHASHAILVLDALKTPETLALQAIVQFTMNCQKRAAYERQLRREKGVSDTFPVSIPSPGVPAAMSYPDEDYTDPEEFGGSYQENHQDSFDKSDGGLIDSSGDTWTDSFVSDFEDEQKRGKK